MKTSTDDLKITNRKVNLNNVIMPIYAVSLSNKYLFYLDGDLQRIYYHGRRRWK